MNKLIHPDLPLPFWKRYYYEYLDQFLNFSVPERSKKYIVDAKEALRNKKVTMPPEPCDYVIASDVLGHIYDIEAFMHNVRQILADDGRIVITQYSVMWEPIVRMATFIGLRRKDVDENWLSMRDLHNFLYLAGFEPVRWGNKILMPVYIPLISYLFNNVLANVWPFSRIGLIQYVIARKVSQKIPVAAPSLSIVVPARNEAGTIERIAKELPDLGSFTELIFIEGNSTDNTYSEIERVARVYGGTRRIKIGKQPGKGKGDAVRAGFNLAEGDILAIYDADMTVPPREMAKFYDALATNRADFINGSRLVYNMEKESMRILNFLANKFFSLAFTWILGQPIKDTLCGTKVLRRSDYEKIKEGRVFFGEFDPFGDFDLLFGAAKLNHKIIDIPIHYGERTYGTTNIHRWSHGWLLLKMTVFAMRKMKFV
jgi:hypothetical protein